MNFTFICTYMQICNWCVYVCDEIFRYRVVCVEPMRAVSLYASQIVNICITWIPNEVIFLALGSCDRASLM